MPEFRYHDELPARGEWPGGKRYGYTFERELRPRVWSFADKARAEELGIELPAMDMQTYESWWDQPDHVRVELVVDDPAPALWKDYEGTFSQRTITAKRWSYTTWRWQPPWLRREPQ